MLQYLRWNERGILAKVVRKKRVLCSVVARTSGLCYAVKKSSSLTTFPDICYLIAEIILLNLNVIAILFHNWWVCFAKNQEINGFESQNLRGLEKLNFVACCGNEINQTRPFS